MIRTLVVDDDFRVARIHATSVDRVDGFGCVGEAHSAQEAVDMVSKLGPDLVLLDLYLPDNDGLWVMRTLAASLPHPPDCIVVTAARDIDSVRAAITLGAVYYLVKPFGFAQLREQLDAYRRWREHASTVGDADQSVVDDLYKLRLAPAKPAAPQGGDSPTAAKVLAAVMQSDKPVSATDIADRIGISRPTAQRHLNGLMRRGSVQLDLAYGATGRPVHLYRPV
ncbi:MAG TPA: response regulator [Jatrophihabitantaceae bacterium]|nr:response regulator [Jatrophihabitantaceae bacterium]